jgi:DNA topoisomerase-1
MKCKAKREMNDPVATFNAKGSPVTIGVCQVCGTKLYRMGKTEAHAGLVPPEKPAKVARVEKREGKLVVVESPARPRR